MPAWLPIVAGAVSGMAANATQNRRNKNQFNQQQQLMDLQQQNQMGLNKQGHDLQYDMWLKTNYSAQMEQLKKAGLNPSLLYGMSGSGGATTGSQGGGSAASGNAPQAMDVGAITQAAQAAAQMGLLKAQKENIEADTENKKAGAEYTSGAQTDATKAGTAKTNEEAKLVQVNEQIAQIDKMWRSDEIVAQIGKIDAEMIKLHSEGYISQQTAQSQIDKARSEAIGQNVLNELNISRVRLTDTQEQQIKEAIKQKWKEIDLYDTEVNIKIAQTIINGIGTAGGLLQAGKLADAMQKSKKQFGTKPERPTTQEQPNVTTNKKEFTDFKSFKEYKNRH